MEIRFKKNGIMMKLSRPDSISTAVEHGDIQPDTHVLIEIGEVEIFSGRAGDFPLLGALMRSQEKALAAAQVEVEETVEPSADTVRPTSDQGVKMVAPVVPTAQDVRSDNQDNNAHAPVVPEVNEKSWLNVLMPSFAGLIVLIVLAYAAMSDRLAMSRGQEADVTNDQLNHFQVETDAYAPSAEAEAPSSFEADGDLSALPAPAASDLSATERVPTMGEYNEQIVSAARELKRVVTDTGIIGAVNYSQGCWRVAWNSDDILKTDFCAAFDFAAIALDEGAAKSMGFPRDDYFLGQQRALSSVYERFSQASPRRADLTQTFAVAALVDLYDQ